MTGLLATRTSPIAHAGAAPRRIRCTPCRVCRRAVLCGHRFCEKHDETDLALARLDAPARAAFRRCVEGGMRKGEALEIAKDDLAIRAKLCLAIAPLTRAALLAKRGRR